MKSLLIVFAALCISVFVIGFNLPSNNSFSKEVFIKTPANAAKRFLFNENNWIKWWPPDLQNSLTNNNKNTDGYIYTLIKPMYNEINVGIKKNEKEFTTTVTLSNINMDSISIRWDVIFHETKNPFTKIGNYFYAKKMKTHAYKILNTLKKFLEKNENIYGIPIQQTMVTDTTLIAKKNTSSTYPTTQSIYGSIQLLKNYALRGRATQTDSPMLHINFDSGYFKTMVALPISNQINGNDSILSKRMFPGKILVAEVTGGVYTINNAFKQLDLYIEDHQLNSPAIPFESLITNRLEQQDTSKWITKIYYPIY